MAYISLEWTRINFSGPYWTELTENNSVIGPDFFPLSMIGSFNSR